MPRKKSINPMKQITLYLPNSVIEFVKIEYELDAGYNSSVVIRKFVRCARSETLIAYRAGSKKLKASEMELDIKTISAKIVDESAKNKQLPKHRVYLTKGDLLFLKRQGGSYSYGFIKLVQIYIQQISARNARYCFAYYDRLKKVCIEKFEKTYP